MTSPPLPSDPGRGPRILFFGGGTALRPLSRVLKLATHRSIHLITPFDSGGSSARLRAAFDIVAVGDLRHRLVALADESADGNPQTYRALCHRLPTDLTQQQLRQQLKGLVTGAEPLIADLADDVRCFVKSRLATVTTALPRDFDLRGASVGNLVLAGGILTGEDVAGVISELSQLLDVRGTVHPVSDTVADIAARLADGTTVVGQHLLTGKEVAPLASPIEDVWLVTHGHEPTAVAASARACELIATADLIVFPMGSFFTSLCANLLPAGIGRAVRASDAAKIYLPNTGSDPEQLGWSVDRRTTEILRLLRRDAGESTAAARLLTEVWLDRNEARYGDRQEIAALRQLEPEVVTADLAATDGMLDPQRLVTQLLRRAAS